ncbi:MAG: cobyrinate a,c-diamide synthase [Desulfuromonas sp.]|nr:cobyrinate a,c-diamide synthase [Desulfuromonas sp.]
MKIPPLAIPRLIIGGAHSSVGKSSVTLALIAALTQRGLKVQTFKVGPDYLDPSHLSRVSGRPCYNLDGWMCDEGYVRQLFNQACSDAANPADIAIVEGVMGLFDGSSPSSLQGSTAQIASWLDAPVLLVVKAHGMARSIAALVHGYANFEPEVKIGAVIANMCGSASHGQLLSKALEAASLPPLAGAIPRGALPPLPSRHLGLVSAAETDWNDTLIKQLADAAAQHLDLDQLLNQASNATPLNSNVTNSPTNNSAHGLRIAIARDAAFQFYYPDLFAALEQRGAELCFFSPLTDAALPTECDALYLGGGYPEVHSERLARNTPMLQAVRNFCASGRPVYAECGGLIYLSQGVESADQSWPLTGILPCWARLLEKRKALGYVEASLQQPSLFGDCGSQLRGHEFHYSELCSDPIAVDGWQAAYSLKQNRSGNCHAEGYQKGNVLASYAHLHLASQPQAVDTFIDKIRCVKEELAE